MIASTVSAYAPIALLFAIAVTLGIGMLLISKWLGAHREGEVKSSPYESGMPVIGDARRRFNVKFYIVAMLFLLFDVEIVFLWPWAPLFVKAASHPEGAVAMDLASLGVGKGFLLVEVGLFLAILMVGYVYAWRKGVFRWS